MHPLPPLSGLIVLSSNTSYYLHPQPAGSSEDFSTHKIFRTQQLPSWKGACGHRDPGLKKDMTKLSHGSQIRVRGTGGVGEGMQQSTLSVRRELSAQAPAQDVMS